MADDVEEQENGEFSLPSPCLHDSDTEVVLHREVLDSGLNPDGEINCGICGKIRSWFRNWSWKPSSPVDNTFDLDKDSHIESIEDESTTSGMRNLLRTRIWEELIQLCSIPKESLKTNLLQKHWNHMLTNHQRWNSDTDTLTMTG